MNRSTASRILAATCSLSITFVVLNGIALFAHPDQGASAALMAGTPPVLVAAGNTTVRR